MHSQLDKLTNDIHRRVIHGVDADSKRLVLHCDFSQDLAHAMADQSMCEYFDIIASSLFICVAHFWDPVTNKRECEGNIYVYIQNFLSPSWSIFKTFLLRVQGGYLFQITLRTAIITSTIISNKFTNITTHFMCRTISVTLLCLQCGQITVQNSSNLDTNWVGRFYMSIRLHWKLFIISSSAPNMEKDHQMV